MARFPFPWLLALLVRCCPASQPHNPVTRGERNRQGREWLRCARRPGSQEKVTVLTPIGVPLALAGAALTRRYAKE
jgi:hypothetical protein